jgi:PAS domain S-box-containing protein
MGLRKRVFIRVLGLLSLLIVTVCLAMAVFSVLNHRGNMEKVFRAEALFLAEQTERLVLWDDRVALKALLVRLVDEQPAVSYAFVERLKKPYVHTFAEGVPRALLTLHGTIVERPSMKALRDTEGRVFHDIATVVGHGEAILHLGLSRADMDRETYVELWTIAGLGAVALALGVLFAGITAVITTREVEAMTNALRISEEQIRAIVDNSPAVISLKDAEGRYLLVNKRFEEWYQTPLEKARGKTSHDIGSGPVADIFTIMDRQVVETGRVHEREVERAHHDGTNRSTIVVKFPIFGPHGTVAGIGGISVDITDRKLAEEERGRLQQQLFQAQKLEALGQLAGGVAHDFNNLLSPIILTTEILLDDFQEKSFTATQLTNVLTAARRARRLVGQILAFSRPEETGKQWLNLARVTSDALDLLESSIPGPVRFKRQVDPDLPLVFANADQLHQVVMNLAMNAAQAMNGQDGDITVSLHPVLRDKAAVFPHGTLNAGSYAVLSVSDTGVGMDEETRERLFEPFFTTKRGVDNSGLGLAVALRIVSDHGGLIVAESRPEGGATFDTYLPTGQEPSEPNKKEPSEPNKQDVA